MNNRPALVLLSGHPYERGLQQATFCPDQIAAVRAAVDGQLVARRPQLESSKVAGFLAAQHEFLRLQDPDGHAEMRGIADGFGIPLDDLFTYLHLNIVIDIATTECRGSIYREGCTSWAASAADVGAWVVKNRDYRGEHGDLQRVFHHRDPQWGARSLFCVGSLGSPGAFSSGLNSDGLVVVDTQVGTSDHGVGWLRYFLMSFLLRSCSSVQEALERISAIRHAGGGTLVLGDARGHVAAVELGHSASEIDAPAVGYVARTNDFIGKKTSGMAFQHQDDELARSSRTRRQVVTEFLHTQAHPDLPAIQSLMSGHDDSGSTALCRHSNGAAARTLSTAIYACKIGSLTLSHGSPCRNQWETYSFSDVGATGPTSADA